jgi:hypothetical protein
MRSMFSWGHDTLAGSGLPALYSLLAVGGGVPGAGCAAGGVLLTLVYVATYAYAARPVRWPYRWERPAVDLVYLYNSLLRVALNSAQIFRQATIVDSDVGAGLCVAPLYALLCMQGGSSAKFKEELRTAATALAATILVVAAARAASGDAGEAPTLTGNKSARAYLFAVTDSAYAFSNMGGWWDGDKFSPWQFAVRAGVFIAVGAFPDLLWSLVGPQPAWLFAAHGALMVLSAMIQAGQVRDRLATVSMGQRRVRAPHRSMMLAVAPALAVGFVYQWGDPALASGAVLAFVVGDLVIFCLQWTEGDTGRE